MEQEEKKPDTPSENLKEAPEGSSASLLPVIKEEPAAEKEEKKVSFDLPIGYVLATELQELYDEDKVTHRQGSSEPEAD